MSQTLARRARIKDLSNKAEGIFQYIGNDNVLFRLISTGNKLTGEKVEGPKVTVKMAKDAGWWNKNGSYWPKMTEMMLKYRAAAYFARAECPEILMGANIDYEVGAGDAEEEGAAHA